MARTAGIAKPDKSLKGVEIDWTGHRVRDGRGYYGEPGNAPPPEKSGAFPPAVPSGPDDVSRRRFSPAEALARELAAQGQIATPKSQISSVTYRDGAEAENVTQSAPKKNKLVEYMARIKADPAAFEAWKEKTRAGYQKWLRKRKEKRR